MRGLAGKVCVVTGGARGIGLAIVERLREEDADVTFLDIDDARGRAEADRLGVEFRHADVSREADVAAALQSAVAGPGRLDVLVNNAGINAYFDAATMTEQDWERVFAVDLKGTWLCVKHALPHLRESGGGSIVNLSSVHALMTTSGMFPYAAAKSALLGLTRSLALDYGRDGIRANSVCPGFVRTQLTEEWLARQPDPAAAERRVLEVQPLGRIGTPAEVASLVAYLASDEASYVTGAAWLIDGGLSARFAS
jgi:NAD(P)-dependent dehydrogenase (short-subunit alcohol dehydrogenase family)